MWAHRTHESHMRTNKQTWTEVLVSERVCIRAASVDTAYCIVDIRYEERSLIVVAYDQVKGVYGSREFWPGCWPLHLLPKNI